MLFDIEKAAENWMKLEQGETADGEVCHSAWSKLIHHLKHHGIHEPDGGLLRVVALFGENFIIHHKMDSFIEFQPGPCTTGIGADLYHQDSSERYLLSKAGRICWEDEHLHRYIKDYTNAWHSSRARNTPDFRTLHDMLEKELRYAENNNDYAEKGRLLMILNIMKVISEMH